MTRDLSVGEPLNRVRVVTVHGTTVVTVVTDDEGVMADLIEMLEEYFGAAH